MTEEIVEKKWEMPPVRIGQEVLYYPVGERNGKPPFMAYIIETKRYTVKIKTVDGAILGAVRHIDDPRLAESPEQRKDLGAWDYTDHEKADRVWRSEVTERLCKVEKLAATLTATAAKKGS